MYHYIPALNSPLINAGIDPQAVVFPPITFVQDWFHPMADILGSVRIDGDKIDIGAFEYILIDDIFNNGFELQL